MPTSPESAEPPRRKRFTQAVVLIHGIGEQKPMQSLRSFAEAVLPEPVQGGEKYFSKPDPLSESFELRKLQDRSQPRTHLFEYYWAYKVEGTVLGDIWSWLTTLLFRNPAKVPKQLRPLWIISWLLLLVTLAAAVAGGLSRLLSATTGSQSLLVSGISALVLAGLQWYVIRYIGDAARYLIPTPRNIKLRQEIRADGIKLLKKIQEGGEYDRVIFVGHSLGSVIAYDILKHVWQECHEDYRLPAKSSQKALAEVERIGEALRDGSPGVTLQDYMDAQVKAWKELRRLGLPWLVTDLVTLGSPLAHAALLLASGEDDLRARQRQRELPTDPPVPEVETIRKVERRVYSYTVWDKYGANKDITLRALHHAALFGCTRWTNIYFPAYADMFGDIVGGPLRNLFGPGVRDIPVRTGRKMRDRTLPAHNSYWADELTSRSSEAGGLPFALETLREVLDLKSKSYFEPSPEK